jgi:hypothetical protein
VASSRFSSHANLDRRQWAGADAGGRAAVPQSAVRRRLGHEAPLLALLAQLLLNLHALALGALRSASCAGASRPRSARTSRILSGLTTHVPAPKNTASWAASRRPLDSSDGDTYTSSASCVPPVTSPRSTRSGAAHARRPHLPQHEPAAVPAERSLLQQPPARRSASEAERGSCVPLNAQPRGGRLRPPAVLGLGGRARLGGERRANRADGWRVLRREAAHVLVQRLRRR